VNFLTDEAHFISKGANAVVSYLHFFFENYGLGETNVQLHCDNCSGQNKNKIVLLYCAWRVAIGLHKSITLNFLIAGHKICTRLVFWPPQAGIQTPCSIVSAGNGISGERECFG